MELTKLTRDMGIIAKLDDEPNDVGGLSAAQLKAKFDEAGEAIKAYLNETLLPELTAAADRLTEPTAAAMLGATMDGARISVQEALDELKTLGVKQGNVPALGAAGAVLRKASDETYDMKWSSMVTRYDFTADDWTEGEDGEYTITVPAAVHQRLWPDFGCLLRHKVGEVYKSNTWATLGTQSSWNGGEILLSSGEAYDGCAMFFDEGA